MNKKDEALRLTLNLCVLAKIQGSQSDRTALLNEAIAHIREALAEQPVQQQEPVAYGMWDTMLGKDHRMMMVRLGKGQDGCTIPLYTSPLQRKPLTDEQCVWDRPDPDWQPDTWEAKCGAMWTFTEGGPKDNDMRYCPQCGKPTIEAAHGIKE